MNWELSDFYPGDILRVKLGSVYHYGICTGENEVVQFGYNPTLRHLDNDNIVVVATDIDTFACKQFIEVGNFTFADHQKRFKPEITVSMAKEAIGKGGYNAISNNCEHFAFECYCGKHISYQEEEARNKWKKLPMVSVYLSYIPENIDFHEVYPKEREMEIAKAKHHRVKSERFWVWEVLKVALEQSANLKFEKLNFKKSREGRWYIKDIHFSLSHTDNLVAVAVSNYPVGVDVELVSREMPPIGLDIISWSKRESIFKSLEKGYFDYKKIDEKKYPCVAYIFDKKYVLTLCNDFNLNANFFLFKDGKVNLIKKGDLEKL